ncbi:T9SS type A sorting domain-containing protein [Pontibacter ruber]|uniref:T9SS type A sorting domain-containing protein n=1 Tax=Pontibacter ruber TaxID=1343895 RepID=A0ABW5CVL9_9BACT
MQLLWLCTIVAVLTFTTNSYAQDLPDPDRCTAQDLQVIGATLTGTGCVTCEPGAPLTSSITFTIKNTTQSLRTSYAYWGTVVIRNAAGVETSRFTIDGCNSEGFPGGATRSIVDDRVINYNCGDRVEVINFYGAWTDASGGSRNQCPLDPSKIAPKCDVVAVLPITTPVVVNAGADFTITCVSNQNGKQIGEAAQPGYTYSWSPTAGLSAANISNPIANPSATTTYTVTKTSTETGCSDTDQVTVTVNKAPVTANAGADFTKTCTTNPSGRQIGEAPEAGFTYAWAPATGLSATNISNPVANPLVTTTYVVTKTNTATGCSDTDDVTVTVNTTPINAPVAGNAQRCGPGEVTLTGNATGAVSYRWYTAASGGTPITGETDNTLVVTLNETRSYWVSAIGANGCESARTQVTGTIFSPVTVEAGENVTRCQSTTTQSIPLTGASITGGATTGTWSIVSSNPVNAGNVLSNNTLASGRLTVAANYVGTITLRLTSADPAGPCEAVSDTRTITINPAAIVEAGGPDVRCQSATAQVIALSGASVTGGATTGTWSIVSSVPANTGNILANNTLASGSLTVAANYTGTITLRLTSANPPGVCSAVSDTRVITINPAAVVNAGPAIVRCQSTTAQAIALAGASVTGGTTSGTWSIVSSVPANSGNILTNTTVAGGSLTVAAGYSGVITLRLTSADPDGTGPCQAVSATRTVTINPAAVVEAGENITRCQSTTTQSIPLTGASITGGATTGTWSIVSSNPVNAGNVLSNNTLASGRLTIAANYVGTITLRLTSADPAGPCEAVSDTRTVTINPAAIVEAGGPDVRCQSATAQVIALTGASVTGGATTGTWSIVSSVPANAGNILTNNTLAGGSLTVAANYVGTITLRLTSANPPGVCSAVSDTRVITINPAATVSAGGPYVVACTEPRRVQLSGTFGGSATSATWTVPAGQGSVTGNIYTPSATAIAAGTPVVLTYTTNDPAGPCGAVSATAIVTFEVCALEGCTPGYWKQSQHFGNWGCGYDPGDSFFALFPQITNRRGLPADLTLLEALSPELGKATGTWGALARNVVAALLNACQPEVNYEYTAAQITSMVTTAFQTGNVSPTLDMLSVANDRVCPLGRAELAATSSSSLQGLEGAEGKLQLKAYPTPFADKATIEFTLTREENYSVKLYDLKGSLIRELKSGTARTGEVTQVEVDGSGLAEGLYIARMVSDSGSGSVKLLLKKQ